MMASSILNQRSFSFYFSSVSRIALLGILPPIAAYASSVDALRTGQPLSTENKRELAEWEEKKKRLGLTSPAEERPSDHAE